MENQTFNTIESGSDLDNFFNLSFDASGLDSLRQLSIWAKIISICAFIGFGFSLASAFFGHPQGTQYLDENSPAVSAARTSGILTAIVTVIITGAINYFLYRFAASVGRGVKSMDALKVNEGFNSLRLYFKIFGILLIIGLTVLFIAILILLAQAAGR